MPRRARPAPKTPSPQLHGKWGVAACSQPLTARSSAQIDRKSTRLNSSHGYNSDAAFCLKKRPFFRKRIEPRDGMPKSPVRINQPIDPSLKRTLARLRLRACCRAVAQLEIAELTAFEKRR